jgi:hypothetical protein
MQTPAQQQQQQGANISSSSSSSRALQGCREALLALCSPKQYPEGASRVWVLVRIIQTLRPHSHTP